MCCRLKKIDGTFLHGNFSGKCSAALIVFFIFLLFSAGQSWGNSMVFSQLDFKFDGTEYKQTDWGAVDFTFEGQDPIMYFNLGIGNSWQVQNIPVLSLKGTGVQQTMTYYFDLMPDADYVLDGGQLIDQIEYGYSFTTDVLASAPSIDTTVSVGSDSVVMSAGSEGTMPDLESAKKLEGGKAESDEKHGHEDFPNQEAGDKECAPAAVSNSLKFLKEKYGLDIDDDKLSIDEMKKAVGFKAGTGAPLHTWWELKDKFMKENGYPIVTKKITNIKKLIEMIDRGRDVEIQESWKTNSGDTTGHTTALVGITKLENGKYSLDISDDRKQGEAGGTNNPRTYIFDPATGNFDELGFISKFEYAVVEYPVPEPSTIMLLTLGFLFLCGIGKRMRK